MANRTVKDAHTVHGTNPQYLIEKIIRSRIYECRYWKEECFAVNEELLVERAVALKYIGGVHGGNIKPTPFLCLTLKMLQIQPAKDIIIEFIRQKDHKYARALGMFYLRLTQDSLECYRYLEPLYNDYRKLKRIDRQGAFSIIHMDEFVDELLREERSLRCHLAAAAEATEEENELDPRVSLLDEELQDVRLEDALAADEDDDGEDASRDGSDRRSSASPSPRRRDNVSRRQSGHRPPPHRQQQPSSQSAAPSTEATVPIKVQVKVKVQIEVKGRQPNDAAQNCRQRRGGGDSKKRRKKDKKDSSGGGKDGKSSAKDKDRHYNKDKDRRDKDKTRIKTAANGRGRGGTQAIDGTGIGIGNSEPRPRGGRDQRGKQAAG
uniref:Pre-mRNA-splicing factor 38 n=1 Tax=Macrostomum lignano TaxID=282301 RepID=A0A1I8FUR4_9PLAT